ncbi:hypothetical protein [Acinetobacter sp. CWB-B33]|uniref:hypothetical protein n=1 Tax=Acinetobacter sp. CWB-B33 TaxID=2815724 RepID=UPI0031FF1953
MIDQSYFFKFDNTYNLVYQNNRIGLGVIRTPRGFHSALLFNFNNHIFLLHLVGHCSINLEQIHELSNDEIYCIQWITNLEQSTIDHMIVAFIHILTKYRQSIPYAPLYNHKHEYFNSELEYTGKLGFSCSSFIFHVFSRKGINFIDIDSWEISSQALSWQQGIINLLESHIPSEQRKTLNTNDFIEELKSELGISPRISPDELSAGGYHYIQQSQPQKYSFVQTQLSGMHNVIDAVCT